MHNTKQQYFKGILRNPKTPTANSYRGVSATQVSHSQHNFSKHSNRLTLNIDARGKKVTLDPNYVPECSRLCACNYHRCKLTVLSGLIFLDQQSLILCFSGTFLPYCGVRAVTSRQRCTANSVGWVHRTPAEWGSTYPCRMGPLRPLTSLSQWGTIEQEVIHLTFTDILFLLVAANCTIPTDTILHIVRYDIIYFVVLVVIQILYIVILLLILFSSLFMRHLEEGSLLCWSSWGFSHFVVLVQFKGQT